MRRSRPASDYISSMFASDSILPPAPDAGDVLHDREYRVRAYRIAEDRVLLQGGIRDQKPPGLYISIDPEPLTLHHMQLSIEISFPEMVILNVTTHFEAHPREECPAITIAYDQLVGLSVTRGFAKSVRELFGGPRGCSHTTALLSAMAPIATQSVWSMRAFESHLDTDAEPVFDPRASGASTWRRNINTCHVWTEDGPAVAARTSGEIGSIPVTMSQRLDKLGLHR
jgi:hypothetical protein